MGVGECPTFPGSFFSDNLFILLYQFFGGLVQIFCIEFCVMAKDKISPFLADDELEQFFSVCKSKEVRTLAIMIENGKSTYCLPNHFY